MMLCVMGGGGASPRLAKSDLFVAYPGSVIWFDGIASVTERCNIKENSVVFWRNGSYLMRKSVASRLSAPVYFRYLRPVEIDLMDFSEVVIRHRGSMLRLKHEERKIVVRVVSVEKVVLVNQTVQRRKNVYFEGAGGRGQEVSVECELVFPESIRCVRMKGGGVWRIRKGERFECIFHGGFGLPFTSKEQLGLKNYTQFRSASRRARLEGKNDEVFVSGVYMTTCGRRVISIPRMEMGIWRKTTELPGEVMFKMQGGSGVKTCEGAWEHQEKDIDGEWSHKKFLNEEAFIRSILEYDGSRGVPDGVPDGVCDSGVQDSSVLLAENIDQEYEEAVEVLRVVDKGLQYIKKKVPGAWLWKEYSLERRCGFLVGIYEERRRRRMERWEKEGLKRFFSRVLEIIEREKSVCECEGSKKLVCKVMEIVRERIKDFPRDDSRRVGADCPGASKAGVLGSPSSSSNPRETSPQEMSKDPETTVGRQTKRMFSDSKKQMLSPLQSRFFQSEIEPSSKWKINYIRKRILIASFTFVTIMCVGVGVWWWRKKKAWGHV